MSSTITVTEVTDLAHPKLLAIANRIVKEMELAIEKTIAHHADPTSFPMPKEQNSVERILQERFEKHLKPEQRQLAVAKIMPRTKASEAGRKKTMGELVTVDLHSSTPVEKQAANIPFAQKLKISSADLQSLSKIHGQVVSINPSKLTPQLPGGASTQVRMNNLELRIQIVKCIDETGGFFAEKVGNDEIALGGTAIDETGDTHKISEFRVGDNFDDGEVITFSPPKQFTSFSLLEGTAFPKGYFVTLVLAEKDMGGLSDFLNNLLAKVQERVKAALIAALGGVIGSSGGPVTAAIGAVVGFVVGKVFDFLKEAWSDDIFPPKTISVEIPSLTHRFVGGKSDSPEEVAIFTGHDGKYAVTYDWRVFA